MPGRYKPLLLGGVIDLNLKIPNQKKEIIMKELPQIWYENENGDRFLWDSSLEQLVPEEFKYYWTRTAREVIEDVFYINENKNYVKIASCSKSYSPQLVLALTRPSLKERIVAFLRTGKLIRAISYEQSILYASTACEACMNALAFERGLSWGYRRYSEDYTKARTSCEICVPKNFVNK